MSSNRSNDTRFMQPERSGSRWPRRIADLVGRALFTGAAIALYVWIRHSTEAAPREEKFSMRVSHEQGPENKASRCPGSCAQMGDTYTAHVWGGSVGATTAIYVYADDRYLSSCESCETLSIVIRTVGKFSILGSSRSRQCPVNKANFDALAASAQFCGRVESSSFDVR